MSDPSSNFQTVTQLRYEPEHARLCQQRMLSYLRDQPRMRALLESLGYGVQILEDDAFNVIVSSMLPNVVGDQLDQWGELVNEKREGLTDPDYRRFVLAKLRAMRSAGTVDDLIEVLQLLTAPSSVRYFDLFPAAYVLQFVHGAWYTDAVARRVLRFMNVIKPAGVGMSLVEALYGYKALDEDATPPAFGFDSGVFARRLVLPSS